MLFQPWYAVFACDYSMRALSYTSDSQVVYCAKSSGLIVVASGSRWGMWLLYKNKPFPFKSILAMEKDVL